MKIPQTIEMQVGALNASEHNPRQITEDDFAELVKSLLLLPKGLYYRPVVVDDRNIALAGNMRLRALKYIHELGFDDLAEILRASYRFRHFDEAKQSALLNYWREWQMHPTVPTLYASELDEDEQQQFIIKDNLSFGTFDVVGKPLDAPVPLESETSSVTEEPVGDVRILAEIRKWEERRDKLLGLDKVQVDITSGGKEFKGFSSVLPVMPGIDEIVRRIDEERERKLSEEDE